MPSWPSNSSSPNRPSSWCLHRARYRALGCWGWVCFATAVALAATTAELEVTSRTKTTKTGEGGSTSSKTAHYVERMLLTVNLRESRRPAEVELTCYFVARHVQSQVLKYCGVGRRSLSLSTTALRAEFESQPVSYAQSKDRNSTHESKRGHVAYGWVIVAAAGGTEFAVKSSNSEILQWVRKNPPRERAVK